MSDLMEVHMVPLACRWPYQPSWELDGFLFTIRLADTAGSEIRALYRQEDGATGPTAFGHPWDYSHIVATNAAAVFQALLNCQGDFCTTQFWARAHAACRVPGILLDEFQQNVDLFAQARVAYLKSEGSCPNKTARLVDEWAAVVDSALAGWAPPPSPLPAPFAFWWDEETPEGYLPGYGQPPAPQPQPSTAADPGLPVPGGVCGALVRGDDLGDPFVEQRAARAGTFFSVFGPVHPIPDHPDLANLKRRRERLEEIEETPTREGRPPKQRRTAAAAASSTTPAPFPSHSPAVPSLPSSADGHHFSSPLAPAPPPRPNPDAAHPLPHHHPSAPSAMGPATAAAARPAPATTVAPSPSPPRATTTDDDATEDDEDGPDPGSEDVGPAEANLDGRMRRMAAPRPSPLLSPPTAPVFAAAFVPAPTFALTMQQEAMQQQDNGHVAELTSRLDRLERQREMECAALEDIVEELLERVEELEGRPACGCCGGFGEHVVQGQVQEEEEGERSPTHLTS